MFPPLSEPMALGIAVKKKFTLQFVKVNNSLHAEDCRARIAGFSVNR
jgi:hypothetical protein